MIEEKAERIIENIKRIQNYSYSDYAGFRLYPDVNNSFFDCFIINNNPYHSSNLSVQVEEINDAVKIIQRIQGGKPDEIMAQLRENGSYYDLSKPIFLHYLKLIKNRDLKKQF